MRNFSIWLLARCQQALWSTQEVMEAYETKDWEYLNARDPYEIIRDQLFVNFALLTGYGPLLFSP